MRTLIIHNTASGPRSDDIFSFQRALIRPGDEVVMRALQPESSVSELVKDAQDFDAVVASGGDGTVGSVAYAVHGTDVPVLAFPSGTANLFANNLGSAGDPPALAQTLRTGTHVHLDLCEFEYVDNDGVLQRRGFLNMAGAGYDASIMQGSTQTLRTGTHVHLDLCEFEYVDNDGVLQRRGFLNMAGAGYDASIMQGSTALKSLFGQFSYYLAALGNLAPGTARMTMAIDGEEYEAEGICVLAANWAAVNQNLALIPGSQPDDGLLDIAVITARNSVELLPAVFTSVFSPGNEHGYPNVAFHHAHEISVECDPPFPMQYDGEVVENATTPFRARVLPGALHTIVDSLSPFAQR